MDSNEIKKATVALKEFEKNLASVKKNYDSLNKNAKELNKEVKKHDVKGKPDNFYNINQIPEPESRYATAVSIGKKMRGIGNAVEVGELIYEIVDKRYNGSPQEQQQYRNAIVTSMKHYENNPPKNEAEKNLYKHILHQYLSVTQNQKSLAEDRYNEATIKLVTDSLPQVFELDNGETYTANPNIATISKSQISHKAAQLDYENIKDKENYAKYLLYKIDNPDIQHIGIAKNIPDDLNFSDTNESFLNFNKSPNNFIDSQSSKLGKRDNLAVNNNESSFACSCSLDTEQSLAVHQEYEDKKTEITKAATETREAMEAEKRAKDLQHVGQGLTNMNSAVTGLMGILENAQGRQSSSYKAMFALSKGFAVAQASLNLYIAVSKAMGEANSMPERFANISAAMAAGVQLISAVQSITLSGQAHAGIDFIPREGTWLLDRGERVVDSRTNADLKQYLRNNAGGSSGGGSISVNVPLSIQNQDSGNGGISANDANLLAGLIKSKVYEIVTNEQRPGGLLSRG